MPLKSLLLLLAIFLAANAAQAQNKLEATGNVGIGTLSPSEKLTLYNGNLLIRKQFGTGPDYDWFTIGSHEQIEKEVTGVFTGILGTNINPLLDNDGKPASRNNQPTLAYQQSWALTFGSGDHHNNFSIWGGRNAASGTPLTPFFNIAGNGYVGIGTTSPGHKLEIRSSENSASQFKLSKDNVGIFGMLSYSEDNIQLSFDALWNGGWIAQHASSAWLCKINNRFKIMGNSGSTPGGTALQREMLTIDLASGNIGIGTSDPSGKFEVSTSTGSEQSSVSIQQVNTNVNPINQPTSKLVYNWYGLPKASINFHRGSAAIDGFMSFSTADNSVPEERMRIDQHGNISIGTPYSYGYKLSVAGGMIAEKVTVKLRTNWADFVFDPAYPLPTLETVESHIREKRHLPGIPSAAELAQQGLDLGDMQQKQMQKIEELTLYVIDLHKKLAGQQALIAEQAKALETLKTLLENTAAVKKQP
ncbi:hypothetical protein [Chitinophaga sp.]|uniref:hypothetical protein n=1 Tax=Chitinophaga sp. TaxID=1869181 RepID=UPI0031D988B9